MRSAGFDCIMFWGNEIVGCAAAKTRSYQW